MHDVFDIGDLIVEQAMERIGENVALIVYYGSRIRGTAGPDSDLDLFYVPVEATQAHFTVLFEGKCFDLHPVSWERLSLRANYDDPLTSTVIDARVVYSRTREDSEKFQGLQDRVLELQKPEFREHMVAKAAGIFQKTVYHAYLLQVIDSDDLTSLKIEAWKLLKNLAHCIAVMNQTFFSGSLGTALHEIPALGRCPENFVDLANRIILSRDADEIRSDCSELLWRTRELLIVERARAGSEATFPDLFTGYYPEIKEQISKIVRACDNRDLLLAFSSSAQIQNELALNLGVEAEGIDYSGFHSYGEYKAAYESTGLPNLLKSIACRDFDALRKDALELDDRIRAIIRSHSVNLNIVESIEGLNRDYWNRV